MEIDDSDRDIRLQRLQGAWMDKRATEHKGLHGDGGAGEEPKKPVKPLDCRILALFESEGL